MSRIIDYSNRLLLIVAIVAVFIPVSYVLLLWLFGAGNPRIIPSIAFDTELFYSLMKIEVLVFLFIALVFIAIYLLSQRFTTSQRGKNFGAYSVLLFLAGNLFAFFALPLLLLGIRGPFSTWEAIETVSLNDQVYRLAVYSPDPVEGSWYYHLYECDSLDLFCREIYTESGFTLSLQVDNFAYDALHIVSAPGSTTISLQVNGEIVYMHRP